MSNVAWFLWCCFIGGADLGIATADIAKGRVDVWTYVLILAGFAMLGMAVHSYFAFTRERTP